LFPKGFWKIQNLSWITFGLITTGLLVGLGHHLKTQAMLLTGLVLASFMTGCVAAFLFTSTSDEANSVGKVRDWAIGGITGLTIVKFDAIKAFLKLFADPSLNIGFALSTSVAITYVGLGFFFMFFKRELVLNLLLAAGRAERGRIEGTTQAGVIALELFAILPASIFAGVEDAEDLLKNRPEESAKIKECLSGDEVTKFLEKSHSALRAGTSLDWDVISKVAYLEYYRSYFVDDAQKRDQRQVAYEWITRALVMNPEHIDLKIKRADTLALMERYSEVVSTLEELRRTPECPTFVDQWLGFYLLYLPGREEDAIRCSCTYRERFPFSNETLRNIASGYAQLACRAARGSGRLDTDSEYYKKAIESLKAALVENPDYEKIMQTTWIGPTGSFSCFASDDGYRDAVHLPKV
jgi:tetratricopeptide (TPR) repeat protein